MPLSISPLWPRYAAHLFRRDPAAVLGGGRVAKPHVISMPSPNHSSRNGARIDTIVLHHTAGGGTAQDVGRYFQNPSAQVSSHYIVGKDGTIVQPVTDDRNAWHAGTSEFRGRSNVNAFSIGIEIVNRGNGSDPYTDAQYKALARLVLYLQSEYGIPWDRITGHKDVALPRGRKTDPSSNFSYARLREEVQRLSGAPAPAPAPQPRPAPGQSYIVRRGDTLSLIAQRELGDANRWREIYELNRHQIPNPNVIQVGQVLRMPGHPAPAPQPQPQPHPQPRPQPQPQPAPPPQPGQREQGEMEKALRYAVSLIRLWLSP